MTHDICLDAGPITLYYSQTPPNKIYELINDIKNRKFKAHVVWHTLIEVYKNLCILKGKNYAETTITSFINNYPINLVNLDESLILKAGALKCQYRTELSYNDCIIIAYSLQKKLILYTTEKDLPKIPNLLVKKYEF